MKTKYPCCLCGEYAFVETRGKFYCYECEFGPRPKVGGRAVCIEPRAPPGRKGPCVPRNLECIVRRIPGEPPEGKRYFTRPLTDREAKQIDWGYYRRPITYKDYCNEYEE